MLHVVILDMREEWLGPDLMLTKGGLSPDWTSLTLYAYTASSQRYVSE